MLKLATKFMVHSAALETAYQAGFRCAEIWLGVQVLADWQAVAKLSRQYPFEYALHFPNRLAMIDALPSEVVELNRAQLGSAAGEFSEATLRESVELYRALDCRAMVIHQPMFDKYHRRLLELEPTLRLGVENHRLTPERFDQWAERNPGLTLDVEHLWKFTLEDAPLPKLFSEVRRFLERHRAKLRHVHLPGYVPGYEEHRPQYCSRDMVFGVLSLLSEFEFDGLIVSEVNLEFQNAVDLRMDTLLFDRWRSLHDPVTGAGGDDVLPFES